MDFISLCKVPETNTTAAEAFEYFLADMEYKNRPEATIGPRYFSMLLRPADIDEQVFIEQKLATASPYNPVWCIKATEGYIFFGALS